MQHGMTVGAHRAKVLYGIHSVAATALCQWPQMMHVDKASADGAIDLLEIKPARKARGAIMRNALAPQTRVTNKCPGLNAANRALVQRIGNSRCSILFHLLVPGG